MKKNPNLRKRLLDAFARVRDAFSGNDTDMLVWNRKMPFDNFIAIRRIVDFLSEGNPPDVRLLMLCGACDFAFTAGNFGYTVDQNLALNSLDDAICEMKSELKGARIF